MLAGQVRRLVAQVTSRRPFLDRLDGRGVTVGRLMEQLAMHDPADEVCFGDGGFSYYRVKDRGGIAVIEFNEAAGEDYAWIDASGKPYFGLGLPEEPSAP